MTTWTRAQRLDWYTDAKAILQRFIDDDRTLIARSKPTVHDGYPTNTRPDKTRSNTTTDLADTITIRLHGDTTATRAHDALAAALNACAALRHADSLRANALPLLPKTLNPDPDQIWCTNHLQHGTCEPRGAKGRGDLCRRCDDWRTAHAGGLPDKPLIDWWAQGKITTHRIDLEWTERQRAGRKKAKAKR